MGSFIHFGCWNKGGCYIDNPEKGWNDLSSVMSNLRAISESENKPEFIVVAGDNYYPNVTKDKTTGTKIKKIVTNDLMSGLECLPDNIPINLLLGNHDVESGLPVDNNNKSEETKCFILDKEIEFARSRRDTTTINTYASRIFNDNTLVLMIDSTIYDDDESVGLTCYRHIYQNETLTLQDLRNDQQSYVEQIISTINKNIKNIVIIGHYPITGYKVQKGEAALIKEPGYTFVNLLYESIYEKINLTKRNKIKYYYLCADLHQYQIANIEITTKNKTPMIIKQYIVGTGGTTLDPYPFSHHGDYGMREINMEDIHNIEKYYKLTYYMTPEQVELSGSMHGFLECKADNDTLAFKFLDSNGNSFVEQIYSDTKWKSIKGGKQKKIKHIKNINKLKNLSKLNKQKKRNIKGGSVSGIVELAPHAIHDDEIDYERCLQTPEFNELLHSFSKYKSGLIYISFGSADNNDQSSNANEQLIPYFLLSESLQRQNMETCQSPCKILCISIDSINTDTIQLNFNKQIVDNRLENDQQIDFIFINIKQFMDLFNSFNIQRLVSETERLNYTLSNKLCKALVDDEINPMNVMIVNYIKFRTEGRKEQLIQSAISRNLLSTFELCGYGNSVYDWIGYFYNLNLKGFIYKTKILTNEKKSGIFNLFLNKIFSLMSSSKLHSLYDLSPSMLSNVYFNILKFIYPISHIPLQSQNLKNLEIDNNFTYSIFNFLENDTRSESKLNTIMSGGTNRISPNVKNRRRRTTMRLKSKKRNSKNIKRKITRKNKK